MFFKTKHLPRYKEIGSLLWRHGRSDVFRQLAEAGEFKLDDTNAGNGKGPNPATLAQDLEKMGPTFIKLGQILSSRADLLPEPYLRALSRLQDSVEPFPYHQVEEIVEAELGARISKAFQAFQPVPIAAASLGQVHRAVLRDGRKVAVKVQRPNIQHQITEDLSVLTDIASFVDEHTDTGRRHRFTEVVEQFKTTIAQELDYTREAANLSMVAGSMQEFPHICVARPIDDYSTHAVLTMTYINGSKVTELNPIRRLDFDGAILADEMFRAYLKQILVDGLFHADPHPGNVFLTESNRIGLIDLGMVGRVSPVMQENLIKLLLAISEGRSDDAADIAIRASETTDAFDEAAFKRRIGNVVLQMQDHSLRQIDIGRVLLEVTRSAGETGLFTPSELTLLGKTLLQLHEIGMALDPTFDHNAAIRRHVSAILQQRLKKDLTTGNLFSTLLEMKDFVGQLPVRVNKMFDVVGKGQLEIKLRTEDTLRFLDGFQKIANRITAGLVLSALIIGAALLMHIPTQFKLFGYPGIAIIFFLLAALGAIWLLFDMFFRDTKRPPKPPE